MKFPIIALLTTLPASAVTLFQTETFDTATQWTSGAQNPNPPAIVPNEGPAGSGDAALRISASAGSREGSRLIAYNRADWSGNYLGQAIHSLQLDLRNVSTLSLAARIAVNGPGGWFVTPSQSVPVFGPWQNYLFDLSPSSLESAGGSDASATLTAVSEIRILHNPDPDFRGQSGTRALLVDNITAVPEPSIPMMISSLLLFLKRRKR